MNDEISKQEKFRVGIYVESRIGEVLAYRVSIKYIEHILTKAHRNVQ